MTTTPSKRLLAAISLAALAAASGSAQTVVRTVDATHDTYVRSDNQTNSNGQETSLLIGNHPTAGDFTAFFKFENVDLTGLASISSVTLRLTSINQAGSGTAGSINLSLFQLSSANSDWIEGASGQVSATAGVITGATFANKSGTTSGANRIAWAGGGNTNAFVAGTDYVNTVLGNYVGDTNTAAGGQQFNFGNAALVSFVSSSIGSTATFNFVILDQTSGANNFLRIASEENTTYAAPQLIIEGTAIPEPSTYAALAGLGALGLVGLRRRRRA